MILFLITSGDIHVVTMAGDREAAKRSAWPYLLGDKDRYIVSPLTRDTDTVFMTNIALNLPS